MNGGEHSYWWMSFSLFDAWLICFLCSAYVAVCWVVPTHTPRFRSWDFSLKLFQLVFVKNSRGSNTSSCPYRAPEEQLRNPPLNCVDLNLRSNYQFRTIAGFSGGRRPKCSVSDDHARSVSRRTGCSEKERDYAVHSLCTWLSRPSNDTRLVRHKSSFLINCCFDLPACVLVLNFGSQFRHWISVPN